MATVTEVAGGSEWVVEVTDIDTGRAIGSPLRQVASVKSVSFDRKGRQLVRGL